MNLRKSVRSLLALPTALIALCFATDAYAGHGIYKSFVIVSTGGGNTYYQVSGGPDNFTGISLGTLCSTGNLKLQGGEANTFDNAGCNQNTRARSCFGG